jgi:hypothetical protein
LEATLDRVILAKVEQLSFLSVDDLNEQVRLPWYGTEFNPDTAGHQPFQAYP